MSEQLLNMGSSRSQVVALAELDGHQVETVTISECNEESFCQNGAIGGFSPPSRSLDLVVGTCLLL